ncbi:MAG: helix-turn-helix domain-containing protein [Candidatus Zixiibacteriota bacterium]
MLNSVGMTQRDLARRTGRPLKTINQIVMGKTAITSETALQFERVLGVSAAFWVSREAHYRTYLELDQESRRLEVSVDWARRFPIKEMTKHEWLPAANTAVQKLQGLLNFFGIASPQEFDRVCLPSASFRMPAKLAADKYSLSAWLRKGEIEAQAIECEPFDAERFRQALQEARALTVKPPQVFLIELRRLCSAAGVAVVLVRELPKMRASGATRWLSPQKSLIQLCLRGRYADIFWFSFFHEAAHILRHGKREAFLDDLCAGIVKDDGQKSQKEIEADEFASNHLIPRLQLQDFKQSQKRSANAVRAFAGDLRISPGIVVGRLQHEGYIPHSHLNNLRVRMTWTDPGCE